MSTRLASRTLIASARTALIAVVSCAIGTAFAQKVNLPKEGTLPFDYCAVSEEQTLKGGDAVLVAHYKNIANTHTDPPGKPFDHIGSICYGTYTNINGNQKDHGVCEWTDADGDKFWVEYNGHSEGGGGTYTAVYGTGKYAGMTLNGEYVLDFWPSAAKDTSQGCFHNKGTYKLK